MDVDGASEVVDDAVVGVAVAGVTGGACDVVVTID